MFETEIVVFIEDTDLGKIVYHSNYLKYMERSRSLFVERESKGLAFRQDEIFVVSEVNELKFLKPALLLDRLKSKLRIIAHSRITIEFLQEIYRGDELLCSAKILIACVNKETMRPCRMPKYMADYLENQ